MKLSSKWDFLNAGDELISPCMCKGTQQFVHRSCLDHWRSVKASLLKIEKNFTIIEMFEESSVFFMSRKGLLSPIVQLARLSFTSE